MGFNRAIHLEPGHNYFRVQPLSAPGEVDHLNFMIVSLAYLALTDMNRVYVLQSKGFIIFYFDK